MRQSEARSESADRFFVGLAAVATTIRERDGLSQREVARRAGIGRPLISKIERGRANPSAMCLDKLAKGLGLVGVAELVTLADESATRLAASMVRPSAAMERKSKAAPVLKKRGVGVAGSLPCGADVARE